MIFESKKTQNYIENGTLASPQYLTQFIHQTRQIASDKPLKIKA